MDNFVSVSATKNGVAVANTTHSGPTSLGLWIGILKGWLVSGRCDMVMVTDIRPDWVRNSSGLEAWRLDQSRTITRSAIK